MRYDVRAIRLIKTTQEKPVKINRLADYICLGHFDMMHVDRLGAHDAETSASNPLLRIQKDRDDVGENNFGCALNYVYSLYLLKKLNKTNNKAVKKFWKWNKIFTVVTRIHCDYPSSWAGTKEPFSSILEKYCLNLPDVGRPVTCPKDQRNGVITLKGVINPEKTDTEDVTLVLYDSLELDDTVAILKSNSISAILEVIRTISNNECVCDTYTYCGIKRSILQCEDVDLCKLCVKNAKLASISTRFSVRNNQNADVYFNDLRKRVNDSSAQYYVTGTADRSINWQTGDEIQLLRILRAFTIQSDKMHICFNDIITRIGICQEFVDDPNMKYIHEKKSDISSVIPQFDYTVKWINSDLKKGKSTNWRFTLLKLLGTLETMYTNYVMDGLANLIIPGVSAFLDRMKYIREKYGTICLDDNEEDIIIFLNCWTGLTNDISQLESQLTQHPELSPIRYYIPAMVLQFEEAFVFYSCNALSEKNARTFRPMLIPADTPDLYTFCPLDPKQEDYSEGCPLLVFIPFKDLYRPWETAFRIAHETAHYCETPSRRRNDRNIALLQCSAVYIANYWLAGFLGAEVEANQIKDKYIDSITGSIVKEINTYFSDYPKINVSSQGSRVPVLASEQWYLSQSERVIFDVCPKIMFSDNYLEKYIYHINSGYFFEHGQNYCSLYEQTMQAENLTVEREKFVDHIKLLSFLCSESYSDIAMVLLLDCSFEEYYLSVYKTAYDDFISYQSDISVLHKDFFVMRQVVRMALVVYAISKQNPTDDRWKYDKISTGKTLNDILIMWSVGMLQTSNDRAYRHILVYEELNYLKEYVAKCAEMLSDEIKTDPDRTKALQNIREGISYVKNSSFDWNSVHEYIVNCS